MRGNADHGFRNRAGHYLLRVTPNGAQVPRAAASGRDAAKSQRQQAARVREVDLAARHGTGRQRDGADGGGQRNGEAGERAGAGETGDHRCCAGAQCGGRFGASANASGEFTFPQGVAAGTYEVLMSSGDDLFIRSVTATGAKIAGRTLHISGSDPVKLSIVVGAGTGKIEGIALRDEKPQSGAMILLVPQDPENNLPLFRRDQSDSDGSFTLAPVLPGRYTLLALENGWDLQWGNAAVLKPFLANGETIVVEPKGNLKCASTCSEKFFTVNHLVISSYPPSPLRQQTQQLTKGSLGVPWRPNQ